VIMARHAGSSRFRRRPLSRGSLAQGAAFPSPFQRVKILQSRSQLVCATGMMLVHFECNKFLARCEKEFSIGYILRCKIWADIMPKRPYFTTMIPVRVVFCG